MSIVPQNNNFVLKICKGISYYPIAYWLTVQDFNDEITRLKNTGKQISVTDIYEIMIRIYADMEKLRYYNIKMDFKFKTARQGIKDLAKHIYGDSSKWEDDVKRVSDLP